MEDWVSSVVAVLDQLGVARVDLLGHHTGALVATEVALQAPARVRRLILNGPFPVDESEPKQYLDAQNEDLVTALDTLESAIRKIDKKHAIVSAKPLKR